MNYGSRAGNRVTTISRECGSQPDIEVATEAAERGRNGRGVVKSVGPHANTVHGRPPDAASVGVLGQSGAGPVGAPDSALPKGGKVATELSPGRLDEALDVIKQTVASRSSFRP